MDPPPARQVDEWHVELGLLGGVEMDRDVIVVEVCA
jgi:hypothetical protein